jgi:hypothetical protein
MFTFEIVATAWLAATAGVLAPSLLLLAAERTAKSVSGWFAVHHSAPLSTHGA